jgi:pyruvate oxidase
MAKYRCTVCNYVYDEEKEGIKFSDLPDSWRCPVCNSPKSVFVVLEQEKEVFQGKKKSGSTVSHVLIDQMAKWGVKYVFGIPGTSSLGLVEAIRELDSIEYFQVRHEQTAAFMASAYGKLTGNVAACLTIAGPGATNLATGLYDAKMDNSPVLALTGQVKRVMIGPGSFQEIDQHSFFEPISVFNKPIMNKEQTTTLVTLAIKQALLKRGVSHLSIPNDVQKQNYDTEIMTFEGKMPNTATSPPEYLIKEAAKIINYSERPVIIAGFGALDEGENILKIAEKIGAPIVTTFRGKGVIDEDQELYVGSHGGIGSTAASKLVQKSDILIVIGSSFSDMTQIPEKRTIQIDIDPLMIARNYPVEVGLLGDSSQIIPKLAKRVYDRQREEYRQEIKRLKYEWHQLLEKEAEPSHKPLRAPYILKVLNGKIDPDAIITLDVGENAWWFGRNFQMKKTQKLLISGSLASMGFGLPAALAAQITYPEKQVVCITGDGGFSMVMADFLTAVKYNLPIKIFLFNNRQLGMIQQEQKVENYPNWQTDLLNCDFAAFAKNCGGTGINVSEPEKLEEVVKKALSINGPVIVDIETDPTRFI